MVREMIVLLRGEATRHSILVRTDLAADLPQILGDRVQLQQVLMNLMLYGSRDDRAVARGGDETQHIGPDRSGGGPSADFGGSRAIAAGAYEPDAQWFER